MQSLFKKFSQVNKILVLSPDQKCMIVLFQKLFDFGIIILMNLFSGLIGGPNVTR